MIALTKRLWNMARFREGLLFLFSFGIYFFYFHPVFLNINSLLSSITGDSLKNYYTFLYHITNDQGLLHFEGMNFPYGEHVVYTDCQPLLAIILKFLPFTHGHLIGILHSLIFMSFVITPVILNRIFIKLELNTFVSFVSSLSIALLSPQFAKISGGHHGLAYGCMIPISILLILNHLQKPNRLTGAFLITFNSLIFLIHPYMGFGCSLFALLALYCTNLYSSPIKQKVITFAKSSFIGILPILLFKLFMFFSDQHQGRTPEPYGNMALVENPASILAPDFGPFKSILETLFPNKVIHFEGHSYLGFFTIIVSFLYLLCLPFLYKKIKFKKESLALLMAGFILLLVSFGLHSKLLQTCNIQLAALNQFRAACRFAWFFYFAVPLFIIPSVFQTLKTYLSIQIVNRIMVFFTLVFLFFNGIEGNAYFKKDEAAFWKFRNVFNKNLLTSEETQLINTINASQTQALLPLPLFCVGSEMYDRIGGDNSMIPAMMLSYHTRLPILGTWMSRTSITETENIIQLLNSYKKDKKALQKLNQKNILVLRCRDEILPDEDRLLKKTKFFYTNDSLSLGTISASKLIEPFLNTTRVYLQESQKSDSLNVLYLPYENKKPFITTNIQDYGIIFVLDSNKLKPGNYYVSLHYHYKEKIYKSLACNLIITRAKGKEYEWKYNFPMSVFSGFYEGFAVFERNVLIERGCKYEFFINGGLNRTYHISDFMLRPEGISAITRREKLNVAANNFPY